MSRPRVLVVEDDHGLRGVLARGLRSEDFDVETARDGEMAVRMATRMREPGIDAIVMDIGLPDSDGRDVCQALRARGIGAPVIFLTARNTVDDRLSGFASGGDDYLPKPFAFRELVARLRSVLRRRPEATATSSGLVVDPVRHAVRHGDRVVPLSPTEFRLLARLLADPTAVVRRGQLKAAGWPDGSLVSDNTLDQYIAKLRRRLADVGAGEIRVARGVGYRLPER